MNIMCIQTTHIVHAQNLMNLISYVLEDQITSATWIIEDGELHISDEGGPPNHHAAPTPCQLSLPVRRPSAPPETSVGRDGGGVCCAGLNKTGSSVRG